MSAAMADATVATRYIDTLADVLQRTAVTRRDGSVLSLDDGIDWMRRAAAETHAGGNKIMFIGNGGSAAIASHLANDFSKNGGLRATAFNDSSALTCLGNDFGYEHVFAKQIELHHRPGDLLVAISSSGRSRNILNGVDAAITGGCRVATLSGFGAENELRRMGDVNFYLSSGAYGFVEIGHLALCHAVLDIQMGWNGEA
jgi:D-sedoheptulose 7-phosphate isomerase